MPNLYQRYLSRAIAQHGSLEAVEAQLPEHRSAAQLIATPDDRYLAEMAACIFRAGFVWRVVASKWPGFEEVFNKFLPIWVAMRSPEQIEEMASDTRIIRNLSKVRAVQENAHFVMELQDRCGGVGQFLADWPSEDITGLWAYLKKHGCRLGGNSGQYFLRFVGRDTFILSRDVTTALRAEGIVDRSQITAKRDLIKVQEAFNAMQADSGRPLCEISMILALSVGPR